MVAEERARSCRKLTMIDKARASGARNIYLLSNTVMAPALALTGRGLRPDVSHQPVRMRS